MKRSLAETNPYLLNPALKKEMVERFVTSSSAIEGIYTSPYEKPAKKKRKTTSRKV